MSEVTASAPSAEVSTGSDSSTEVQSEGNQPNEAASNQPTKAEAKAILKEKFKLTVDGEEIEDELDWNDKEGIKRRLQMAHAAKKRIAEAQVTKNKAQEMLKAFENGDEEFFEKMGPKGREAAEKFLLKQIQRQMETPEQKAQREKDEKLKKYEDREAEEAKKKEADAQNQLAHKYAQDFQTTIVGALEKLNLPKSPALVKSMASLMSKNLKLGLELDAADLADLVRQDKNGEVQAIVKDMDGDQLIAFFGEDIANKIRKSDLRKLQEKHSKVFQSGPAKAEGGSSSDRESRPMSMEEWRESINRRVRD